MGLIAAAVAAVRLGNDRPGLVAGPAVFALVLASSRLAILPGDLEIPDGASAVGPARIRLIVIAAIAGAVLIGTTRDPAPDDRPACHPSPPRRRSMTSQRGTG